MISLDIILFSLISALIGFAAVVFATPKLIDLLKAKDLLDKPVDRSSHETPTPIGGGWIVVPVILIGLIAMIWATHSDPVLYILPVLALGLMLLSWQDDKSDIHPGFRFLIQAVLVGASIFVFEPDFYLFNESIPFWLDRAITFWALLWFVNLYNFMDGIDGITGTQTASIGVGVGSLMLIFGVSSAIWPAFGFLCAGAALGFLVYNWHKAKIFIGDVGAIPLGFLMGWYLMYFAGEGFFWAACIIPLYYCFDTTITIVRRMKQGHPVWVPHRLFFFQAAIPHKLNHAAVVLRILALNIFLWLCAFLAANSFVFLYQLPAILASGFATLGLLYHFEKMRKA